MRSDSRDAEGKAITETSRLDPAAAGWATSERGGGIMRSSPRGAEGETSAETSMLDTMVVQKGAAEP